MAALVARTAALGRARFHVLVSSAAVRALHGAAAVAPSALTPPAPAAVAAWLATGAPPAAVEDAGCAYTPEWRQRSMIGDEAGEAAVMEDGVAGGEAIQAMNRNAREGTKVCGHGGGHGRGGVGRGWGGLRGLSCRGAAAGGMPAGQPPRATGQERPGGQAACV